MQQVQVDYTVKVPGGVKAGQRVKVTVEGVVQDDGTLDGITVDAEKVKA